MPGRASYSKLCRRVEFMTFQWRLTLCICLTWILQVGPGTPVLAQPQGEEVFQQNCVACHTIGEGDRVGPDLEGVASRRSPEWFALWVDRPRQMVESGDSIAVQIDQQYEQDMVSLGLSSEEIAALMEYFGYSEQEIQGGTEALEKEAVAESGKTEEIPIEEASVRIGRKLFTGRRSFENGGARCQSCHDYAGLSAPGGGNMGPDLTEAHDRLGQAVVTWPASQPPMRSLYEDNPLTEKEKAHLLAFLKSGQGRAPQRIWTLLGYALGGAGVLFGVMAFIWRDRLREVRRPMIRKS